MPEFNWDFVLSSSSGLHNHMDCPHCQLSTAWSRQRVGHQTDPSSMLEDPDIRALSPRDAQILLGAIYTFHTIALLPFETSSCILQTQSPPSTSHSTSNIPSGSTGGTR